jgi:hypothetical protein
MRAIVFFVELLLWLMIVRIVLRGLGRMFGGGRRQHGAPAAAPPRAAGRPAPPAQIEDLVQDPVCRTYFPRSRAVAARVAGRDELYCSTECRDKALAAVGRAS